LGDVYAALGKPDEARAAWEKSLAIESNEEVRNKLESAVAK
jgi:predicted negative regulator of RcsB-dependent stress response